MSITKEQWQKVQDALSSPYGQATLICDGYRVNLQVVPVGNLKFGILPYVNGWSKGEWLTKDCEERRRFMRSKTIRLHTAKQIAEMTRGLTKRAVKKYMPGLDKTMTVYSLAWQSFAALKRHLTANNKVIEFSEVSAI